MTILVRWIQWIQLPAATITVPLSPPDVQVVAAGIGTYTQIDTGVTCKPEPDDESTPEDESIGCANLKAFIVSSGLDR